MEINFKIKSAFGRFFSCLLVVLYDSYVTKTSYHFTMILNMIEHKKWNIRKMISNVISVTKRLRGMGIKDDTIKTPELNAFF